MLLFRISDKQHQKFLEWKKQFDKNSRNLPIGGYFTWCITPTSFGNEIKVIHNITKKELNLFEIDLSLYDPW